MVEAGLVALVLAATLGWVVTAIENRRLRAGALALIAAASAALGWIATGRDSRPLAERDVTNRPIQVSDDGYGSSSTCRACHPSNYASWYGSWHRTMTQVATAQSVVGNFGEVEVEAYGQLYRLERRGDEFWVEMDDPEHAGPGAPPRLARRILVTTGSHHEQDYWYETGRTRKLGFLPLMYLIEDRRWIPFSAGFLQPPPTEAPTPAQVDRWHTTCIKCHATHGKPRTVLPDDANQMDTTVAEFGIACEACHGPGAEHVRANRDPIRRYGLHFGSDADPTIVNPARLSPRRASQVCGQCHGIHRPLEPLPGTGRRADDWRDHGLAYRPGDELEKTRYVVRANKRGERRFEQIRSFDPHILEDRFWADGMVRVSGREYNGLIESPCFERGRGERKLSCLSCHSMHREAGDPRPLRSWAVDQMRVGMRGNRACVQCHRGLAASAELEAHTRHRPESSGSGCYNCHMPFTTYGLLKAIRSHTIDSPSVAVSRDTGRPNACNQCHLDKTLRWTSAHLAAWYDIPQPDLPPVLSALPRSVVLALAGDAGQRALVAWSMGWEPAMEVSASEGGWMAQLLARLLVDPYPAVRYVAYRSLRRQPGFVDFEYDYMAPREGRLAAARRAAGAPTDLSFLIDDPEGKLPDRIFERIASQRSDRRVSLAE